MLRLEKRPSPSRFWQYATPLLAVVLGGMPKRMHLDLAAGRIVAAIRSDGLASVEDVGAALQAGTNCGSCRPEIAALLRRAEAA